MCPYLVCPTETDWMAAHTGPSLWLSWWDPGLWARRPTAGPAHCQCRSGSCGHWTGGVRSATALGAAVGAQQEGPGLQAPGESRIEPSLDSPGPLASGRRGYLKSVLTFSRLHKQYFCFKMSQHARRMIHSDHFFHSSQNQGMKLQGTHDTKKQISKTIQNDYRSFKTWKAFKIARIF